MKRTIALLAALIMLMGMATAQQQQEEGLVNTVIVTSAESTQDSLVATGPAKKLGIPILHVENDSVPEPTKNSLELLQPSNIVMVGGPEVMSSELESELGSYATNSTTRIWGMSATGTSVETSEYYWPEGSNQTAIIHTSNGQESDQLLRLVEEIEAGNPILLSDGENISASVLGELDRLNSEQVTVYTNQQENLNTTPIENLGIEQVEVRQDIENISTELKRNQAQQIANNIGPNDTLVLAAGQETGQIVTLPYLTDLYVFGVPNEANIDTATALVQQVETDEIWVTGGPELVNDVVTIVEDSTDKELRVLEGEPIEIIDQVIQRRLSSILSIQENLYGSWEEDLQSSTELQISAERQIEETRNLLGSDAAERLQSQLEQAELAYNRGNYFEARKLAVQTASQARIADYTGELPPAAGNQSQNQTENGILE